MVTIDEVERLKAQLLLKEAEAAKTIHFRAQVSAAEATEKIHANEIETLKQRNVAIENEKNSLDGKVTELQSSVFTKDLEIKDLNAALSSLQFQNDWLLWMNAQLKVVKDKVAKLDTDLAEMTCHLEEKFYPHLLTTISGRRVGRSLTEVAAYNPSAEANFNSALQELREIDFPLLAKLKSYKDASVEDIMSPKYMSLDGACDDINEDGFCILEVLHIRNLLHLEGPLTDAPGMGDLQPDIEQLKVPIHRSEDQVVFGETSMSFVLSVSHSLPTPASLPPLSLQRPYPPHLPLQAPSLPLLLMTYEIVHVDGQEISQGNVQVDAATIEFEKEDLDTTPERDLLS
ncbi:hypothetical protein Tco_0611791 [Tanacetum coccineum]